MGQQKAGRAVERSKTLVCSIPQVNRLTDHRLWLHDWVLKGHPQKTLSQARMQQGSPLCENLCGQIVQQFKKKFSTHNYQEFRDQSNIIKRFR